MALNIIYGPPGSGKTTAIQTLESFIDFDYISIGEIYRREVNSLTSIGKELKRYTEANLKYPNNLIKRMVKQSIDDIDVGRLTILDGFPKYKSELTIFKKLLKDAPHNVKIGSVFFLKINQEDAFNRIYNRVVCTECDFQAQLQNVCPRCGSLKMVQRKDDNEVSFKERFSLFMKDSNVIIDGLKSTGFNFIDIDAAQDKKSICSQITYILDDKTYVL